MNFKDYLTEHLTISEATGLIPVVVYAGRFQPFHINHYETYKNLVNEFGAATYFMTLKDVDGLLKQYAFVSVENYNIVGVGNSIAEARNNYYTVLKSNGILSKGDAAATTIKGNVERINYIEKKQEENIHKNAEKGCFVVFPSHK